MIHPCFICSEPHWHKGRLQAPAIDPTALCIHREMELLLWETRQQREADRKPAGLAKTAAA